VQSGGNRLPVFVCISARLLRHWLANSSPFCSHWLAAKRRNRMRNGSPLLASFELRLAAACNSNQLKELVPVQRGEKRNKIVSLHLSIPLSLSSTLARRTTIELAVIQQPPLKVPDPTCAHALACQARQARFPIGAS